jgi:hypothetical protein
VADRFFNRSANDKGGVVCLRNHPNCDNAENQKCASHAAKNAKKG